MAQRKKNNASPNKRNRSSLEYQRFEDRKLLAGDLGVSGEAIDFSLAEITRQDAVQSNAALIRDHLAGNAETAWLQQGLNDVTQVATESNEDGTTTVFQHSWNGLPVFDSYVTVVQDSDGEITNVRDQARQNISGYALDNDPISAALASNLVNRTLGTATTVESSVSQAWYYAGNKARLAHLVETTVSDSHGEFVGEYETWVNVFDGNIFNQRASNSSVDRLLEDPIIETGIFPRIVINDAIGAQGSRDFAAPFNSVVSISVGCTGTLISPDSIITARHCGIGPGDTISFGTNSNAADATFSVASTLEPGGGNAGSPLLDGGDVTILTLTSDVPVSVATPVRFIDATDELVGLTAVTVGYGFNGIASTGHQFSADGFRWGGENVIDAFGSPASATGSNIISTDFDDGTVANNTIPTSNSTPLEFEATTSPGDSGGPILVDVGGEWVIAGVLSGGTDANSFHGDVSWWTGTTIYRSQIEDAGGSFVGQVGPGSVQFDRDTYFIGDTIGVQVRDTNAVGDIEVTVTSDTGDSEVVTVSPDSAGVYSFTLESAFANIVLNDGTVQLDIGDQIEVSYTDIDDGEGNSFVVTDTANIIEIGPPSLVGIDFDSTSASPVNWTAANGNGSFLDLTSEDAVVTNVDLEVVGTATAFDVPLNADTIPQHPNSLANVDGQIFTNAQPVSFVYSDLNPLAEYEVYVLSAEAFFSSIEQTVTIQGDGTPVSFEQRFNQSDLFINDQVGDSNRELSDYAQVIVSDANGQITIDVAPIAGTSDVVIAGLAIFEIAAEDESTIRVLDDSAVTDEDQSVNVNVLANDSDTEGATLTLDAVGTAENGTVTLGATGTVDYTPNADFAGTDSFTYTISNPNGDTATGNVTVQVNAVNDAPSGALLSSNSINEDADTSSNVLIGTLTGQDVDDTSHTFQLVEGSGDADNALFVIQNDSLSILAGSDIDFDTQPQYSIRVLVSDGELSTETTLTIDVIAVTPAVQIVTNNGDSQRSIVRDNVISFNDIVTFGTGAFELVKRGPDGGTVDFTANIDNSSGRSVVTLAYSPGEFVSAGGALVDGNYQLTVLGDLITTSTGAALDADEDGNAGGNFVYGDTAADNFFSFFGDVDGNRIVTTLDLLRFRQTFLDSAGDDDFDERFDRDEDGVISTFDLLLFRRNFLDRLDFA